MSKQRGTGTDTSVPYFLAARQAAQRATFECLDKLRWPVENLGTLVVAVGTTIAHRPPRRSVRAALPHTAPVLDSNGRRNSAHRTPVGPGNTYAPALCRARVRRTEVLLDSRPSLHPLRPGLRLVVRRLHRYYGAIRLLRGVPVRLVVIGLPGPVPIYRGRPRGLPVLVHIVSRRARGLRLRRA